MSIELPQAGNVFFPDVPITLEEDNKVLYEYLNKLSKTLASTIRGLFDNDAAMSTAINSGTSGTFVINSGDSITIANGVVITATV